MPTTVLTADDLTDGKINILAILEKTGIAPSRSQGRTLVSQGGISVDGEKVTDTYKEFSADELKQGIVVKKGKKIFIKVVIE